MKIKILKSVSLVNILSLVAAIILPIIYYNTTKAEAAGLNITMVRLDNMVGGAFTSGTVCARPTTASTEAFVQITFPTSFTVSTTVADWAVNTTNLGWPGSPTPTAWPGIGTQATSAVGKVVTFASTDLTVGTTYCFNWTNTTAALQNPAGANIDQTGILTTRTSVPADIDSSPFALATVTGDTVLVTGTVNPTFSFSLSASSATFTAIGNSVANVVTPPTATVITNARNGWTAWVKDANNGTLNSAGTGTNIPTPGAVGSNYDLATMTGPGAFGLGITTSGGSSAPSAEYTGVTAGHAGTLSNAYRIGASSTTYATSDVITLLPRAIASVTQAPASDYTDTITIVAAGQF